MERETGIGPATNSLEGCDSTTELLPLIWFFNNLQCVLMDTLCANGAEWRHLGFTLPFFGSTNSSKFTTAFHVSGATVCM